MKKLLLSGIAALFLATGAAQATEDGCAVVLRTPDGFLNVRAKPNARSRILKRLKPGEIILQDNARLTDNARQSGPPYRWDHVYVSQIAPGRPLWGWVRNKYIVNLDADRCESNWEAQKQISDQ